MIIYLDTEFEKGEKVQHRTNEDIKFIVTGFLVTSIKDNKATEYLVQGSNGITEYYLHPEEIEKEPLNK